MFRSLVNSRHAFARNANGIQNKFKFNTRKFSAYDPQKVINCAIIAHVDHGKTTLMDKLLTHCGTQFSQERAMDSNVHEQERGITIMSKYTRLHYKDHTLHVVDTPGHADFGGEVERILSMVDGVVLLVDASEGAMSQTKFVLSKALGLGKKAIVVLNKVDREGHRADEVELEVLDLFCALTSNEDLLTYPLMYASAKNGWVVTDLEKTPGTDVSALLDSILETFPPACTADRLDEPFRLCVNTIQSDNHLGRIVTGKVESGTVRIGDQIKVLNMDGELQKANTMTKVTKLFYLEGLTRVDVTKAHAGEVVSLAGCAGFVGDTVCSMENADAVATSPITPPVIAMTFGVNDSPFQGKEGSKLTSSLIKNRLELEVQNNVTLALRPCDGNSEAIDVLGRGELQLGILIETMRREGFEMTVSPPKVLGITGEDGKMREPIEEVLVDVEPEYSGAMIEMMSLRKGKMTEYKEIAGKTRLVFEIPSRGLMGFRTEALNATRGTATINSMVTEYDEVNPKDFSGLRKGKLVSMDSGKTTAYTLDKLQERGSLFVGHAEEVYEGMVIGENAKKGDLDVNPVEKKKLTNVRSVLAEDAVRLIPPRRMTVEEVISYMDEDEVIEVTPKNIRLRKRILNTSERQREARRNKERK